MDDSLWMQPNRISSLQSNGACRPLVKKRAALCLLKMIRKTPADQQVKQGREECYQPGCNLSSQRGEWGGAGVTPFDLSYIMYCH